MRFIALLILTTCCFAEDAKPEAKPEPVKPTVTADDLQNLAICARQVLPSLTPEQMTAIATAIKHAEDDAKAMRAAADPKKP